MENVIWKKFLLSELFSFSSGSTFALKNYDFFDSYDEDLVEVVTSSKDNKNFFIEKKTIPSNIPIYKKSLTINRNGSIGYCFYHEHEFIIPTGDSYTLIPKSNKMDKILTLDGYYFLSILITHIFTSTLYGYSYKVNSSRFDREIILLPCLEISSDEEYIWEENGHYYTLAVDYIKKLMNLAKEEREKKTIRLYEAERAKYEAERAKYEAERAKYEAGYRKEKELLVWKGFRLEELFNRDNSHQIKIAKKNIDESPIQDDLHTIKNITASKSNNGCSGYLIDEGEVTSTKKKGYLTIASDAAYGGICFYQKDYFVSTGHSNLLTVKNDKLKKILDLDINNYYFMAKMISICLCNGVVNRFFRSVSADFDREIILLPCLEISSDEEYIWEENGHYYTLAVDYISYLFLTGKINYNQKKIDDYTYQY